MKIYVICPKSDTYYLLSTEYMLYWTKMSDEKRGSSVASIGDVAKLAGVSRSTVSSVCNNKGYVSKETREKIERAMKELNYIPSELGRNLKKQRSGMIGIIVPDVAHPFFATFLKYAEKELYQHHYKTMICGTAGREDVEQEYLNMLERRTMDGVIMGAHSLATEKYLQLSRPVLAFDRYLSESIPAIHCDKRMLGEEAAKLFLQRGRKNIVHLISSHTIRNFEEEAENSFRDALEKNGVKVTAVSVGYNTFTIEKYQEKAQAVFEQYPDTDGILGTDLAILSCMKEAVRRKYRVPQDISMVAIDGTYAAYAGDKTITALVQPLEMMARQAVKLILDMVEERGEIPKETILPITVEQGETL